MYQGFPVDSPEPKHRSPNRGSSRCTVFLTLIAVTACLSFLGMVAYRHFPIGMKSPDCPEKLLSFKVGSPNREDQLWAYATFWSLSAGQRDSKMNQSVSIFAPAPILADLEHTFKPLSLQPFEHVPERCKSNIPDMVVHPDKFEQGLGNAVFEFPENFIQFAPPLFSADLTSEFRFKDDISDHARNLMEVAASLVAPSHGSIDNIIPIYLSTITPEMEKHLSVNGSTDVKSSQMGIIQSAMDDFRRTTNPLFLVLGNHSEAGGLEGTDVFQLPYVPDNVALALISSSNATIFNHGLWPAFGALLGRSNVTSYAMNKTLLESANNASLNWKTSVAY